MNETINKNTYYMTPRWFINACITVSRAKSGRYYLNKTDSKKGLYFNVTFNNMTLKVPFKSLFETNDKIAPIKSLSFISAIDCPSAKRGLCQLNESKLTCYAVQGQLRASGTFIGKNSPNHGLQKLNSHMTSELVTYCLDIVINSTDNITPYKFSQYIRDNIPIVRFNLKGDFRNIKDILLLSFLARQAPETVFYGYSARDDLLTDLGLYLRLDLDNIFLNGSNNQYTNRFMASYDLKKWLLTNKICLGGCTGCKKCYSLKNSTIICLVHGKNQDQDLNTFNNRLFIIDLFNKALGLTLDHSQLTIKKGLLESLNGSLKRSNIDLSFKDYWNFRDWFKTLDNQIIGAL